MQEEAAAQLAAAVLAGRVPSGAWAVGVSGGADSVALLQLLVSSRDDLKLIVVHLNHELRGEESDQDERFVRELATSLKLLVEAARASDVRSNFLPELPLPANASARYRRLRFALFANVVREHHLDGVILAHHADDQAETVFHRLLRGSGYAGLCGMSPDSSVRGVRVLRPLLGVRASWLREYLRERTLTWREDSSNRCGKYLRNRIRQLLHEREDLHGPLIDLAEKCRALRNWVRENAPRLDDPFEARQLADLSELLARESAGRWLRARGVPSDELSPAVAERLLTMCEDAASPPRVQFPGGVTVRRRAGRISAEPS